MESDQESSELPQIIDVTDTYSHHDEQLGASSMDELTESPETVVTFPSEAETIRRAELALLPKEQLIDMLISKERELRRRTKLIHRLRQVNQYRRNPSSETEGSSPTALPTLSMTTPVHGKKRKVSKNREIDFAAYGQRHVAFRFLYLGWNYHGFVVQDDTDNTVEDHIFASLIKTKLIEARESSSYHRCGRTDKSVSAFSQVISLNVRSTSVEGPGVLRPASSAKASSDEIPYLQILNGVLPKSVRIVSWSPVANGFSARFNCQGRKYRYYFPRGNLDITQMNSAARLFLGEHDFRNFCKADINGGVTNYVRRIDEIFVAALEDEPYSALKGYTDDASGPYKIFVLHVYGSAFLWHQVRSIGAVLFLIGQGKEDPAVISELLDIVKYPAKPQYAMAEGFPLVLFGCEFAEVEWGSDDFTVRQTLKELEKIWTEHSVKAAIIRDMMGSLGGQLGSFSTGQCDFQGFLQSILPENKTKTYQMMSTRRTCDTIENRLFKKLKVSA